MVKPEAVTQVETAWNNSTTPKETAEISVQPGDVLVAAGISETNTSKVVISGGFTWTQKQKFEISNNVFLALWTSVATEAKSFKVKFTREGGTTQHFGGAVQVWRKSAGVGASAGSTNNSGAPSLAITTEKASSAIAMFSGDWEAKTGAATYRTGASAFTQKNHVEDTGFYTLYGGYHAEAGAAGAYTVGMTAPASQKYTIAAVEIKGEEAGGGEAHKVTATPATETDAAVSPGRTKRDSLTPATETDAAQALSQKRRATASQAVEASSAQSLSRKKRVNPGPVGETDAAQAVSVRKRSALSQAAESDGARGLVPRKPIKVTLAPAGETSSAQARSSLKHTVVLPATEASTATGLTVVKRRLLTPAEESEAAVERSVRRLVSLDAASESDGARPLTWRQLPTLLAAAENDAALVLGLLNRRVLVPAGEVDTAQVLHLSAVLQVIDRPIYLVLAAHDPVSTLGAHVPSSLLAPHAPTSSLAAHDPAAILADHDPILILDPRETEVILDG